MQMMWARNKLMTDELRKRMNAGRTDGRHGDKKMNGRRVTWWITGYREGGQVHKDAGEDEMEENTVGQLWLTHTHTHTHTHIHTHPLTLTKQKAAVELLTF